MLRPTPAGATNPLETACFPLVPYANRIADGRFTFAGESYALPRNMDGQDHPLHGVGWLRSWQVQNSDAVSAILVHAYQADANWPSWSYRAEQHVSLDESGLRISLSVQNTTDRAMPAGLGFHPYFPGGRRNTDQLRRKVSLARRRCDAPDRTHRRDALCRLVEG